MAIKDYDCQAVIWCAEVCELPAFFGRAVALTQKAADKAVALKHEIALYEARISPGMDKEYEEHLAEILGKLTDKSRLYVCGHGGDGPAPKLVRWDAKSFVGLLKKHGLKRAKLINLVSCKLARDYSPDMEDFILTTANSFAAEFHRELKKQEPALLTEVRAYTWKTRPHRPGLTDLAAELAKLPYGSKLMTLDEQEPPRSWAYKPKGYKISFYWEGDKQRRRYMNKDGNSPIDEDKL